MWWGHAYLSGSCSSRIVIKANVKQSTFAATTTKTIGVGEANAADECSANVQGSYTATTTETVQVEITSTGTGPTQKDLMWLVSR
jgi:hypothetical protein